MKSENIEILIKNIQLRPKMYIEDISIKNLYFFLSGYVCSSNQSSGEILNESKKIDSVFHSEFTKWSKKWILLHFKKDYTAGPIAWYHAFQFVTATEEEALVLFFESSHEFFIEYHKNKR